MKQSEKQITKIVASIITGNIGSSVLTFIIGLLILKETNSALNFGISQVIGPLVALILLPVTGALVDKYNKKKILICAQFLSIAALFIFGIFIFHDKGIHLLPVYVLLIFLKISDQFLTTGFTASIINLVAEKDIQKLKSIQQLISAVILVFSPIMGALLFNRLPLLYLIIIEIFLELLTIWIISSVDFHFSKTESENDRSENKSILALFSSGLLFVKNQKLLVFVLFFSILVNFIFGAINVGLPFVQISVLHFSNTTYGITESIFSLGMILSSIFLSFSKDLKFPIFSSWIVIGFLGILITFLGFSLSVTMGKLNYIFIVALFNFLIGIGITFANLPMTVWMTKEIPPKYQGRVFNLLNTGAQLLSPIGILIFSALFNKNNSPYIFIIAGLSTVIITVVYPLAFKVNMRRNKLD